MNRKKQIAAGAIAFAILLASFLVYRRWESRDSLDTPAELFAHMPADGNVILFVDLSQLRTSPFFAQLLGWAPQASADSDYAQFLKATGFNYERDLDRLALAINRQPQSLSAFAIAEGRFDRKKIESYAAQYGSLKTQDGRTLYAVPISGSTRKAFFTFLRDDRIAWANDSSYFQQPSRIPSGEWREHFSRLAGTPLFVILKQDSGAAAALAQAPGGLHSPQLTTLLAQLQWISIGGKPEGSILRVVIDGECLSENTVRRLKEVLGGIVVLAQAGLSDPKTRKALDPQVREGYLELLQSVDIQQLDRSSSKSVRVVFDVTPGLLHGAQDKSGVAPAQAPASAVP